MSQKVIPIGSNGSVSLGQDSGIAEVQIQASAKAGGGDLKDFAEVGVSAFAKVHEDQLIDVGFAAIEAKAARLGGGALVTTALEGLKAELKTLEAK